MKFHKRKYYKEVYETLFQKKIVIADNLYSNSFVRATSLIQLADFFSLRL